MNAFTRILVTLLAAAPIVSVAALAQATPSIQHEFSEPSGLPPDSMPCSTCHEYKNTGIATVRTPFGISVLTRGLNPDADPLSTNVYEVMQKMVADNVDSDGDGIQDMLELKNHTDPNTYGAIPLLDRDEVKHGCQCSSVGGGSFSPAWAWLASGLGLAVLSARRATRRGRPSRA